jgi:hypothetical protein
MVWFNSGILTRVLTSLITPVLCFKIPLILYVATLVSERVRPGPHQLVLAIAFGCYSKLLYSGTSSVVVSVHGLVLWREYVHFQRPGAVFWPFVGPSVGSSLLVL